MTHQPDEFEGGGTSPPEQQERPRPLIDWTPSWERALAYHVVAGSVLDDFPDLIDPELFGGDGNPARSVLGSPLRDLVRLAITYHRKHGKALGGLVGDLLDASKKHRALKPLIEQAWTKVLEQERDEPSDYGEIRTHLAARVLYRVERQTVWAEAELIARGEFETIQEFRDAQAAVRGRAERVQTALDPQAEAAAPVPPAAPYRFEPAFPNDHLISQVIEHVAAHTDAALEFAEAGALVLLAACTPNIKARLGPYPKGLGTNLYVLGLGGSTTSRKSTVKNLVRALHEGSAVRDGILPDAMTPEALLEQMAQRDGKGATWYLDELGETLAKLHHAKHMEGMKGHLLSLYDGLATDYARHSKRVKGGDQEEDHDAVQRPNLSIFGVTTPLLFHRLNLDDIESGLLPRFAIVAPRTKPERRSLFHAPEGAEERAKALRHRLDEIHRWNVGGAVVRFTDEARALIDQYDGAAERRQAARAPDDLGALLFVRHLGMLVKVSMLAAIGRPGPRQYLKLSVEGEDVRCAARVLDRWAQHAEEFARNLSTSEVERKATQCLDHLRRLGGKAPRRTISRNAHTAKRMLDDIEATLVDRGEIRLTQPKGAEGQTWIYTGRGR